MRRKLSFLVLALAATLVSACANPAAPSRDGDLSKCERIVTVGTQTRCALPGEE